MTWFGSSIALMCCIISIALSGFVYLHGIIGNHRHKRLMDCISYTAGVITADVTSCSDYGVAHDDQVRPGAHSTHSE